MKFENILNKKINITQIKSGSKLTSRQKACIIGLGLRGINSKSKLKASNSIIGMIRKIQHIIKIN